MVPTVFETRHAPLEQMDIHRHAEAYASLVLDGSYDEISSDGRFYCVPGVLTIHPQWHQHADIFGDSGATVLNLPAPGADCFCSFKVVDASSILQLAHQCPVEAACAVSEEAAAVEPLAPADWLVKLTALLSSDGQTDISCLAARCGVSAEHAIRACKRWFGISPAALRREKRLQVAISLLKSGAAPAEVAFATGFSDQPHLTRLLKRATGLTPALMARR
jgi:AraC-like DNA-binding protein